MVSFWGIRRSSTLLAEGAHAEFEVLLAVGCEVLLGEGAHAEVEVRGDVGHVGGRLEVLLEVLLDPGKGFRTSWLFTFRGVGVDICAPVCVYDLKCYLVLSR